MPDLPSGTVTLLFTDIEGSTRLFKQLRDGYAEVLADHQRLLREAVAAHGGREVDTQGDSFFVAFARARDAVLAAADAQQAFATHPWPVGVVPKVRMGLHTESRPSARSATWGSASTALHESWLPVPAPVRTSCLSSAASGKTRSCAT